MNLEVMNVSEQDLICSRDDDVLARLPSGIGFSVDFEEIPLFIVSPLVDCIIDWINQRKLIITNISSTGPYDCPFMLRLVHAFRTQNRSLFPTTRIEPENSAIEEEFFTRSS